jgi:ADP-L-glycero-D-manno-heptose 6-epimerase
MRILVTGGSGFIGSNLVKKLLYLGHDVLTTGNHLENEIPVPILEPGLFGIDWDQIGKIDVLYHLAANNLTTSTNRSEMFFSNSVSSAKLFHELYKRNCKKFIFASSTAVYGNQPAPYKEGVTEIAPLNAYAESKAVFESFCKNFYNDIDIVCLRYSNVYGPGECHKKTRASMICQILKRLLFGKNPKLFKDGNQKRCWLHVSDCVSANIKALDFKGFGIFNCGNEIVHSFNELLSICNYFCKTNIEAEWIDNPYFEKYQDYTCCDLTNVRHALNWEPMVSLECGVDDYVKFLRSTL